MMELVCLNPHCGGHPRVEGTPEGGGETTVCDQCGTTMPIAAYTELYAEIALSNRLQQQAPAPSRTARMDAMVAALVQSNIVTSDRVALAAELLASIDTKVRGG